MQTNYDGLVELRWDPYKDEALRRDRGVSFDEVASVLNRGEELAVIDHPVRENQRVLFVRIRGYVHAVPFVTESDGSWFLKTIFPTRKGQREYGGG